MNQMNTTTWLNPQTKYPISRIWFEFTVQSPIGLPEYAGSMLRGAFGGALRRTACMTRQKTCNDCPLRQTCPYPQIFEKPAPERHSLQKFSAIPNGYIIEPPTWGERVYQRGEVIRFAMVLVGQIRQHLSLVTYAWQRAFEHGIGHGTATLTHVNLETEQGDIELFDEKQGSVSPINEHSITVITPNSSSTDKDKTLDFYSPLRLQSNGKALSAANVTAAILIKALARRASLILEFHAGVQLIDDFKLIAHDIERIENAAHSTDKHLQWQDWTRYSSRQRTTMQLGGLVGQWHIRNVSPEIQHLLALNTYLHIGKETTFGMGGYTAT